jgi:release factor glutamine methyltransferase
VPDPRSEACLLLAHLLDLDGGGLLVRRDRPLDPAAAGRFAEWIDRRARREPSQHITGVQEFHGLEFEVDRHVLIPRPETEGLVDAALDLELAPTAALADLGTGSGCVAITLARRRPGLRIHALDRSERALRVARANAARHRVAERVRFRLGDLADPPADWLGGMDAVLSNPPYVSEPEWERLAPEVRDHDPREALVAGPEGLDAYTRLAPAAFELLRPGGFAVVELGFGQADRVRRIFVESGLSTIEIRPDLNRIPRVLVARRL